MFPSFVFNAEHMLSVGWLKVCLFHIIPDRSHNFKYLCFYSTVTQPSKKPQNHARRWLATHVARHLMHSDMCITSVTRRQFERSDIIIFVFILSRCFVNISSTFSSTMVPVACEKFVSASVFVTTESFI